MGELRGKFLHWLWKYEQGQDIAECAVMLAVILVIVVGTIRLIGGNANNLFSSVGSAIQWSPAVLIGKLAYSPPARSYSYPQSPRPERSLRSF